MNLAERAWSALAAAAPMRGDTECMPLTGERSRSAFARCAMLAAIAGMHALLIGWLLQAGPRARLPRASELIGTLIFPLEREAPRETQRWRDRRAPDRHRGERAERVPRQPPAATRPAIGPPRAIDWLAAASESAARIVQEDADARRRARAFGVPQTDLGRRMFAKPERAPPFAWAATAQRIEPLEGGGMLLRLSDRCSIALTPLPFPVCSLGKIEARGDLFEHMHEIPRFSEEP